MLEDGSLSVGQSEANDRVVQQMAEAHEALMSKAQEPSELSAV